MLRTPTSFCFALFLGLLLIASTGCDSGNGDDGGGSGSSDLEITGDFSASISGDVIYGGAVDDDGTAGFAILAVDVVDGDTTLLGIVRIGSTETPSTGTYDVGSFAEASFGGATGEFYALYADQSTNLALGSDTGTLTITSSGGDQLSGEVSIEMVSFFGEGAATLSGTFTAAESDNIEDEFGITLGDSFKNGPGAPVLME